MSYKKNKLIIMIFLFFMLCFLVGCSNLKKENKSSQIFTEQEISKRIKNDESIKDSRGKDEISETKNIVQPTQGKINLDEINKDKLLKGFLYGKFSIENPFVEGMNLNAFGWEEVYSEWKNGKDENYKCSRKFAFVDLNGDKKDELLFSIGENKETKEVILLLHSDEKQLYCWDIYETHSKYIGTSIYENGIVQHGESHTGAEETYYQYDNSGNRLELIHFDRSVDYEGDLYFESYYLNGNKDNIYYLNNNEEYEKTIKNYLGELKLVSWLNCSDIMEINKANL